MTALLDLRHLSGGYSPIQSFRNVDPVVEQGKTVGFFGPNGHGKTTLMKTISGVLGPCLGDVIFERCRMNRPAPRGSRRFRNSNHDAVTRRRMDPKAVARPGLIHVAQGNLLFPEMTVDEVLSIEPMAAAGRDATRRFDLASIHGLLPRLAERHGHKIRYLSCGERQMVSIAAGLLEVPRLLILDQPAPGLSPKLRLETCQSIRAIKDLDVPLIGVGQDVAFLSALIDRLHLFDHGRISRVLGKAEVPGPATLMSMLFGTTIA
jgi:branched-chain amino acid transport system ATP-binding protein